MPLRVGRPGIREGRRRSWDTAYRPGKHFVKCIEEKEHGTNLMHANGRMRWVAALQMVPFRQ